MKPACESCVYWDSISNLYTSDGQGHCRRNAPGMQRGREMLFALWPITRKTDWCGEWAERAPE